MKHKTIRKITPVPRPGLLLGMLMPRILPLHPCPLSVEWLEHNAMLPARVALEKCEEGMDYWLLWLARKLGGYVSNNVFDAIRVYSRAVEVARHERTEAASGVTQAFVSKSRDLWWNTTGKYSIATGSFAEQTKARQHYNDVYKPLRQQFDADIAQLNGQMTATERRAWRRCAALIYPVLMDELREVRGS